MRKNLSFPWRASGKLLAVLGRIPANEFHPRETGLSLTQRSNWMTELIQMGIIERLSFGRYRVLELDFVAACQQALRADPDLAWTFQKGTLLPFLAAHTASGDVAPVQRVSGLLSQQWSMTAERLVRDDWLEPVDAARTRLKAIRPEVRALVEEYRALLTRHLPYPCIHQSGCEAAWLTAPVPSDWSRLPEGLISTDIEAPGATVYRGFRRLDELDQLLLAAKAADGAPWNQPWTPSAANLVVVASRLTLNQSLGTAFRDRTALYGCEALPGRVLELQLAWSGFPGCSTKERRRDLPPIAWNDMCEGQHRSRYGIFPGYAVPTGERRPLMRRSSRYTKERAAFGVRPASRRTGT